MHKSTKHEMNSLQQTAIPVSHRAFLESFADPRGKIFLVHGDPAIYKMALLVAVQALVKGEQVPVVDGCNRFDLMFITKLLQRKQVSVTAMLERGFISRGFTCHQLEQAVTKKLPAFLETSGSTSVVILGLLDTFYDDQAKAREVKQILERVLSMLDELRASGISILIANTQYKVLTEEKNSLFPTLRSKVDQSFLVRMNENDVPKFYLDNRINSVKSLSKR